MCCWCVVTRPVLRRLLLMGFVGTLLGVLTEQRIQGSLLLKRGRVAEAEHFPVQLRPIFLRRGPFFSYRVDGVFHSLGMGGLAIDSGRRPPAGPVLRRGLFCSSYSLGTLGVLTCHDNCRCWVRALVTGNSTRALLLAPKCWCDFSYQLGFDTWPLFLARTRVEPRAGMV